MRLVFWDYQHLHVKIPLFTTEDLYNLNITIRDLINKYRYQIINDSLAIIKVHKIYKTYPYEFIDKDRPYWDYDTKIYDYINFYQIKAKKVDMIISIIRN